MACLPIPQICLKFLLRSKTYLIIECLPSASIANREFPLSNLLKNETGLHTLQGTKGTNYTAVQWFTLA